MTKNKIKTNKTTVYHDNNGSRCVHLERRKYFFVSDLVKTYGSGFLNLLEEAPVIRRITHGKNSQTRRLVPSTDFNAMCRMYSIRPKRNCRTSSCK